MDNILTVDEPAAESLIGMLQCEFCGKRGYVHTFLGSKRFCSMTCVRLNNTVECGTSLLLHQLSTRRDISNEFRSQEIDSQALLLLAEKHLMTAMNIKLGPALKLCTHIYSLKEP